MHELSLSSAIVDAVLRHSGGARVARVHVRVGALRQVVPEALAFAFALVAEDTPCAGARLELELVPARLQCQLCGRTSTVAEPPLACRECGGGRVDVLAGNEFVLDSLEIGPGPVNGAEEERACTAAS